MKIKQLPPELISQIAAGEVVERPSSVIKELVENSVDAGARNIIVEIDLGGAALIRVTDDGLGMSSEDARLAVNPHTTSKIFKFEDLYSLQTLGFRGEALASISAVSQFSLVTRRLEDLVGTQIARDLLDWRVIEVGCNTGTQVSVKNLFYNVPARRKFLRSASTEYNHIVELMESFGLLWPQVGFRFVSNGKTVFDWPCDQPWGDRCRVLLGQVFKDFLPVSGGGADNDTSTSAKIFGWVGKPFLARPKRLQYLFINNRVVSDFMLARTVKDAFGNLIAKECFPPFVLKVDLPPGQIDVNVHPRKTEVKIADSQNFYRQMYRVVQGVVLGQAQPLQAPIVVTQPTPPANKFTSPWTPVGKVFEETVAKKFDVDTPADLKQQTPAVIPQNASQTEIKLQHASVLDLQTINVDSVTSGLVVPKFTIIGYLSFSYIVAQVRDAIYIFDQHAVSERLKYEEIKKGAASLSQGLLHPMSVELSLSELNTFIDRHDDLAKIGWELEPFGDRTLLVRAVPTSVRELQAKSVLTMLLKDIESSNSPEDLWKSMACHTAVRFGDELSLAEQEALVRDAFKHNVQSCPHGRPVCHKVELEDLHKLFKRRGF